MAKLSLRYLHKWDSAIDGREEEVTAEWADRLAGLSPEQIVYGLEAWAEDWPPSSEEFRKCCLGHRAEVNEYGLNYVPEYYRQTDRVTDRSRLLSSDDRDKRRASYRAGLDALKKSLEGGRDEIYPAEESKTAGQ